ncbi:hypothetical protein HY339_03260 [Candidatus Gottesmanbacteria bacterium]|nr:hypothetical protein [Candidatus Gottesmanbacteria bacterium]
MVLVYEDRKKKVIKDRERINFSSFSSFHLIVITARAKGKRQISDSATDDEDLTIKIDDKTFPKLSRPERLIDSPAAFSGGTLHGLSKIIYFLTFLKGKDHTLELITDKLPNIATLESLRVYALTLGRELTLVLEQQAEDGDRRPWITFVFDQLALESFTPTLTYSRRLFDSDDIKIIFDGKTYSNFLKTLKYFLWRFAGFLLPDSSRTEKETFTVNASPGLHYLEFWADRKPTLEKIQLVLGNFKKPEITLYKNLPGRDYSHLDQFILEAVSFWNDFFAREKDAPPLRLDPSLVKAIVYRESRLGYYPDNQIVDVMQVWDPQNPAKDALLGKTVANEFISPSQIGHISYSYPDFARVPKVNNQQESLFWGVRWLYYKSQYLLEDEKGLVKPYVRKWRSWREAVRAYNANPEIGEEYVSEVFSVYEKGVDLEGNTLW